MANNIRDEGFREEALLGLGFFLISNKLYVLVIVEIFVTGCYFPLMIFPY